MKRTLAITAIAIMCATGGSLAGSVASAPIAEDTATMWNGKWQGTTVSGHPIVLQIQIEGQRMKGRLTVGKQSANIIEGKVSGQGFALVTGPIDGYKVSGMGRHLGDAIEFSMDGVKEPLTLTRMK